MNKSRFLEFALAPSMVALTLFITGALGQALAQDQLSFPLESAPGEALLAASEAVPDASFTAVDVEVEDGVITLEFQGVHRDGRPVEVDVALTWHVLEVEDVISMEEVPDRVKETLELQMGDFQPTSIERSERGTATVYEFEGIDAEGRHIDIEVQADGESIIVLDDDET